MTGTLNVDPAKLKNTASSFQSTGGQIRSITGNMTTLVKGLSGQVWSGEAATKYVSQFSGLQDDIERMIRMVEEHVSDLNEMADAFIQAENIATETSAALQSDVIS